MAVKFRSEPGCIYAVISSDCYCTTTAAPSWGLISICTGIPSRLKANWFRKLFSRHKGAELRFPIKASATLDDIGDWHRGYCCRWVQGKICPVTHGCPYTVDIKSIIKSRPPSCGSFRREGAAREQHDMVTRSSQYHVSRSSSQLIELK